jgi:hypothetical protein
MSWTRPDWKNPDLYDPRLANPANPSLRLWAWEFLRRNSDYQLAFEGKEQLTADEYASACRKYCLPQLFDPALGWGQAFDAGEGAIDRVHFLNPDYQKFPDEEDHAMCDDSPSGLTSRNDNEIVVRLYFDRDLSEQLKRIQRLIETVSPESTEPPTKQASDHRLHVHLFPRYLRLLDAKEARATDPQILEVLDEIRSQETLEKTQKAACEMRDAGFLRILSAAGTGWVEVERLHKGEPVKKADKAARRKAKTAAQKAQQESNIRAKIEGGRI